MHSRSIPCVLQLLGLVLLSLEWGVDCFQPHLIPATESRTLFRKQSSTACTSRDRPVSSVLSVSSRGINGSTLNGAADHVALNAPASFLTKIGMISFVASMCLALPATLLPQLLLFRLGIISRTRKERWALATSQFCARFVHRLFPFCKISVKTDVANEANPLPAVWACNHTSMLDVFILLIADRKLRGPKKRPIKIVYWKNLEDNPVTALLFRQAGFIPVAMAANKPGEENQYDKGSLKQLLKSCKQAFDEGFDIGILPEGQLNPEPEKGLLPIFTGAFTLARLSKRPIRLMARSCP